MASGYAACSLKTILLLNCWTMTPNPGFKVTPFFDAEYLRNGTRYRHSFNGILIGTYNSVVSNDLE